MDNRLLFTAVIAAILGAGFYFGYLRNEAVCYKIISNELEASADMLERWKTNAPDYVIYTELELLEMSLEVAEYRLAVSSIKADKYRNLCDYYWHGMSLRRK